MIEALMLFGSAARGDVSEGSDVDLLAVSCASKPFSKKLNGMEIQFIGVDDLIRMAESGDLFAMHLATEGKVIFDFVGHLARLKERATPKDCYEDERNKAFDLAWFLHDSAGVYDKAPLINKRIAWCVRTVVIAKLADAGEFIFSPRILAERFPDYHVPDLIGLRRSTSTSSNRFKHLISFLEGFEAIRPDCTSSEEYLRHFSKTNNAVALSTYNALEAPTAGWSVMY